MSDLDELERLADALPVLVWMTYPDGELFFFNATLLEFTGLEAPGPDQDALYDAIHPNDVQETRAAWQDALLSGEPFVARFRLRHRDGGFRWTYSRAEPVLDDSGSIARWYGSTVDIHEQKMLEEAAEEQSRRLASTLDCIVDGFLVLDDCGRVLYLNDTAAALLGLSASECVGQALVELLPETAATEVGAVLEGASGEEPGPPVALYLEGRARWCELRCFRHEDGTAISLRDVTDESHNYRFHALQAQVLAMIHRGASLTAVLDELLHGVDGILPDGAGSILLLDEDGVHIRHASAPSLPDSYNHSIDGLAIGPHVGSCGTAMYRRERVIVEDIASDPLWAGVSHLALEIGLRACWSTPLFDGAGEVIGSFAVYYRTPRRPTSDELQLGDQVGYLASLAIQIQRQEAALRESEERFRQMDEAIDDVFWMEDIDSGRLIYLSPTFAKLSGYTRDNFDEVPAEHWNELVHPDDRARIEKSVAESHRTWELPPEGLRYRIIRADGDIRWVNDRAFLIRDAEGKPWRLSGVIRDITDQLAVERQLRASQRMESLGQLTGGIAHDFNNLLTVILGNAELLEGELSDDPHLLPLAEMIVLAAQRGSELTQRLLAFARRQPLEPRAVSLDVLVEEMMPLLSRSLGQCIDVRVHHQRPSRPALVDPVQLEASLLNLCLNARDAMEEGGTLSIETALIHCDESDNGQFRGLSPGDYVRLSVSDTGTGIAAEDLERVFEPFFTTKTKSKGTGLGLAMVYGFATQSHGLALAESEPGLGSTFHLYLPVAPADYQAETEGDDDHCATPAQAEWILVVEDDALVRDYVHGQLRALGYRVLMATDGREALNILQSEQPVDLLFTNVVLADGLSGPELTRSARRLRPDVKVLYTSGFTDEALEKCCTGDGEMLLLNKPYRRGELAARLRRALEAE